MPCHVIVSTGCRNQFQARRRRWLRVKRRHRLARQPARPWNREHKLADQRRSIPLSHFEPLARIRGVRLFSLQKGYGTEQLAEIKSQWPIIDLGNRLEDFTDTAAVMMNLDLIISADTAPAHLAGALGRPVWTVLSFAGSWRWLLDREDSPWYPTMRLFRQKKPGGWAEVFERIAAEVRTF